MRPRWVFQFFALAVVIAGCTAESADTTVDDTSTSVPTSTTTLAETTTIRAVQDPDEAVDVVRQLLEAVMIENQTAIVELVDVPEGMDHTTDQVRNVLRFAVATGWLDDVGGCGVDQREDVAGTAVVSCEVWSAHPIFGFPDQSTVWDLVVHGDRVVDADPAPYAGLTDGDAQLLDWLRSTRSTVSGQRCGPDAYEASEAVTDVTSYPIHPRCGSYLNDMMASYFIATQPDHPVAVWETFEELWGDQDMEVLSLFAEDAVIRTESTDARSYRGLEEIREWVIFEFDNFADFTVVWYDYEVDGSNVSFIHAWGPGSEPTTGRKYTSVVEDGLIHEWNSGETVIEGGIRVTESDA